MSTRIFVEYAGIPIKSRVCGLLLQHLKNRENGLRGTSKMLMSTQQISPMIYGWNSDHANEVMRFPGLEMFIYGEGSFKITKKQVNSQINGWFRPKFRAKFKLLWRTSKLRNEIVKSKILQGFQRTKYGCNMERLCKNRDKFANKWVIST